MLNRQSVQFSRSVVSSCLWPHGLQHPRPLCPSPTPWSLLKLMPIESVMPFNHLILCHPLLLLPSIIPSIRVCSSESVLLIRWPKYWSFSFSIIPSKEIPGLISFRMDWLEKQRLYSAHKGLSSQGYHFYSSRVWILELDCEEGWAPEELMLLNCGVGEDSWEFLGLQREPTSPFWRR